MTTENLINDPLQDKQVRNLYVMSGGGSRGRWQFQALEELIAAGYKPHGMTGTSTGTLTCFLYVEDLMEEGRAMYEQTAKTNAETITKAGLAKLQNGKLVANTEYIHDVLLGNIGFWDYTKLVTKSGRKKVIKKILDNAIGIRSLMDNTPLKETILSLLALGKDGKRCPFTFNRVSLQTGGLIRSAATDFSDPEKYAEALVASTSVPGIWPGWDMFYDGGIREGTGLAALFDEIDPEYDYRIFVLSCNRRGMAPLEKLNNLAEIAGRTISIMMDESTVNDLSLTLYKNQIAKEYGEKIGRKYVPIHIIESSTTRGVLDFTEESFAEQIECAKRDVSNYLASAGVI